MEGVLSHDINQHRAFIFLLARLVTTHGQEDVAASLSSECKLLDSKGHLEYFVIKAEGNRVIDCTIYRIRRSSFRVMDSNVGRMLSMLRGMGTKRWNVYTDIT